MKGTGTLLRGALVVGLSVSGAACGGGSAATSTTSTTSTAAENDSGGSTETANQAPPPSGRTAPELATLRPASVDGPLAAVTRLAEDSDAAARGAIAYADTDVAGMTLVWGQAYRILDHHGRRTVDVATAMARVIRERFTVSATGVDARLAPAGMPIITGPDGRTFAAFGFVYQRWLERMTAPTAALDTFEGAAAVFEGQATTMCHGTEPVLDDPTFHWICDVAGAGMTATYARWVIGPAFGPAWEAWQTAHASDVDALERFMSTHPFRPRRATRADDLHPIRRGS